MNNKGFAVSGVFYSVLIVCLVVITLLLFNIESKKTTLDKLKIDSADAANCEANIGAIYSEINAIKNNIYPVGSIYMSVNSVDPSALFGGTWEQVSQGRVIVGAGSNDGYTFTVDSYESQTLNSKSNPLGEYSHKLTINEMPEHSHSYNTISGQSKMESGEGSVGTTEEGRTGVAGGNAEHNNIQPYMVAYIWKRVS